MIQDVFMAIPLGILLCFLIGPVFFIVLETAATKGFRAALVFDLGVVTADFLFIAIAIFSSYRLINSIKDDPALYIFGGLIMITYGIISFLKLKKDSKILEENEEIIQLQLIKKNYRSLYFKGLFLNFINVGVLGFWFLIFLTFGPVLELKTPRLLVFFSTVIVTYLLVDILKMVLAKKLKNKLTPTNILKIKQITSVLLVVFGISIMLQGWFPSEQKFVKKALEKIEPKK
jgi:threonine/homoserine/homoserine lactone efflux protein